MNQQIEKAATFLCSDYLMDSFIMLRIRKKPTFLNHNKAALITWVPALFVGVLYLKNAEIINHPHRTINF